jgi:hypothetical protein
MSNIFLFFLILLDLSRFKEMFRVVQPLQTHMAIHKYHVAQYEWKIE